MAGTIENIAARTKNAMYTISIGNDILLDHADMIEKMAFDKKAIVVSSKVYDLFKKKIDMFKNAVQNSSLFIMNDSEENKNYMFAESFLEDFIKAGLTRKSVVVGIGGGVVGDFAGYLAALYMRGIAVIHVPTTLLSMIDSSIGGKVAVNLKVGKNIIGAFHQPSYVISDISFLSTLDPMEFTNGLTESLKHGLIGDENTLNLFKENDLETLRNDHSVLQSLIYYSANFKSTIVEQDETESGLRAILNYGHTVGHAIESLMEYNISHGEAVAIGIKVKNDIAFALHLLTAGEKETIEALIDRYGLLHSRLSLDVDSIIEHMVYDKKNANNKVNFVLLKGIGNPLINQQIDRSLLHDALKANLA